MTVYLLTAYLVLSPILAIGVGRFIKTGQDDLARGDGRGF